MAVKVSAPGNAPSIKQKTPPPDQVSHLRSPSGEGYGQNSGFANPSSMPPGQRVISPLAANLESSVDDDGVRDTIINRGLARDPSVGDGTSRKFPMSPSSAGGFDAGAAGDEMLRSLADGDVSRKGRVGVHPAMAPRGVDEGSPGGKVGGGLSNNEAPLPSNKS